MSTAGPRAGAITVLLAAAATLLLAGVASAQLFQWTPQQLVKYTGKNPYDRFPDGRPRVPDDVLQRMKGLVAEEARGRRSCARC